MKMPTALQQRRNRTVLYFFILLALLPLLVTASYTWISIGRNLRVTELALYVNSGAGIALAKDYDAPEEDWGAVLDFQSIVGGETMLKPATLSEREGAFYTVRYGSDGRLDSNMLRLNDADHANRNDADAYYVTGTYYLRAKDACMVSLGEGVAVDGGTGGSGTYVIGTPLWDPRTIRHSSGGSGAEASIRVLFELVQVDPLTGQPIGESTTYLYEPNCDVTLGGTIRGYRETVGMDGRVLGSRSRLILQTASTWTESSPVQQNVTIKQFGRFLTDNRLLALTAGDVVRVRMSIWLEGMDVDCTNDIRDAQITMNIQFATNLGGHGGLVEIED